jgi:hypothetical protein
VEALDRVVLDGLDDGEGGRRRADVGLIPVFVDERPLQGLAGLIDWRTSGRLSNLIRAGLCSGRSDDALLMPGRHGLPVERLVMLGLGRRDEFDASQVERTAERIVEMACSLRATDVLVSVPDLGEERDRTEQLCSALDRALARRWDALCKEQAEPQRESECETAGGAQTTAHEDADGEGGAVEEAHELPEADATDEGGEREESGVSVAVGEGELVAGVEELDELGPVHPREVDGEPCSDADPDGGQLDEAGSVQVEDSLPPDPHEAHGGSADPAEAEGPAVPRRWWIVAPTEVVVRLRSLLSGSPKAARSGAESTPG